MGVRIPQARHRINVLGALWKVYKFYEAGVDGDQVEALAAARAGDWRGARWMLQLRNDYEYEGWDIEYCVSDEEMDKWIKKS